uniref:Uncharacterized protein n=1 Tax=Melopsittacus undulatus TaxID=13146 RepID=A0A8V5FW78_MELUD
IGIALVLAQKLGPYKRTVVYFSKQCLRAVAAVVMNIEEACKFTLGQKITVPCCIRRNLYTIIQLVKCQLCLKNNPKN